MEGGILYNLYLSGVHEDISREEVPFILSLGGRLEVLVFTLEDISAFMEEGFTPPSTHEKDVIFTLLNKVIFVGRPESYHNA